jgi:SAM-dependent methyltransferase
VTTDLDHDRFADWVAFHAQLSERDGKMHATYPDRFDAAFFLETIEHLQSPYHAVVQLKSLVKPDGDIFVSTPTETVWHNTPYPSLFWPPQSFAQWLAQMALPIIDAYTYEPKERGWPAYQYRCRNAGWHEAKMLYPKSEPKFFGKKPHEYANL